MKLSIIIILISILIAGTVYAQQEELLFREIPTVIAATRREQKITEAPSFVTVITDEEIEKFGYRTLAEALRGVIGFYTSYDREYVKLGVRGYNRPGDWGNRILLMVNGHYYNENIYGGAYTDDTFGIDLDIVKRIEIIRGPASALYGTNALFAVINVVAKTGEELEGWNASVDYGTNNANKEFVSFGKKTKENSNFLFAGSLYSTDGYKRLYFPEFDSPPTSDGWADNLDYANAYRIFANLNYGNLSIFANTNYRKKAFPTAAYCTVFNDPRALESDKRSFVEFKLNPKISSDKTGLLRFYYDNYVYQGDFPTDYPPVTVNRDNSEGNWWGSELQLAWDINPYHKLTAGGEYQNHTRVFLENFAVDPYASYLSDNRPYGLLSFYLQDEIIFPKMGLTLGIRNDSYPDFGNVLNPRAGLVVGFFDDINLKILYGRAFRAPTPFEKYYGDGFSSKPNLKLRPETINTYELVLERGPLPDLYSTLSIYRSEILDLITQVTDPADMLLQYQNVDRVEAYGAEVNLKKTLVDGRSYGYLGVAYQKAWYSSGNPLENSPTKSGNAGLVYAIPHRKASAAVELIYLGQRKTLAGNYTNPYLLTNLTLRTEEFFNSEISLKINNLFDIQYSDPGSAEHQRETAYGTLDTITQDRRTWQVKVSKRF